MKNSILITAPIALILLLGCNSTDKTSDNTTSTTQPQEIQVTEVSQMVGLYNASYNYGSENIAYRYIGNKGNIFYYDYLGDEEAKLWGTHEDCYTVYQEGDIVSIGDGEFLMHRGIMTSIVTAVIRKGYLIMQNEAEDRSVWEKVGIDINVINSRLCNQ